MMALSYTMYDGTHTQGMALRHTLITWPLALLVDSLMCHTTMRSNSIYFLYNPGHVTLGCLEVVPVVYARVALT